jgi:thiamine-phosphate pyrophosphorylase
MKLVVISASGKVDKEAEMVTQMFEMGLQNYHLRKPKYSTKQLKQLIDEIPAHFHGRIVIHSHHILAARYNLKGIHLTRVHKQRRARQWITMQRIRLRRKQIVISTSFRKIGSLYEEEHKQTYVFLSPIFDSLSGKYQSGFNEFSLKEALAKTPHNVVARGGMDESRIAKASELGFYGIAFYSTIWKSKTPVDTFANVLKQFESLGIKQS